jgi:hypothetical protein
MLPLPSGASARSAVALNSSRLPPLALTAPNVLEARPRGKRASAVAVRCSALGWPVRHWITLTQILIRSNLLNHHEELTA